MGKGILQQIKDWEDESIAKSYKEPTYTDMFNMLTKLDKKNREYQAEQDKIRDSNITALQEKSKELDKEIPEELLVFTYVNQPVGSWFFDKYKEWLE